MPGVYGLGRQQDGTQVIIPLDQEHDTLVSEIRREWAYARIDVVLDYLWGHAAEAVLEAMSQKGLQRSPSRVRFVQVGDSAGKTISLAAATLRGSAIELLGSGVSAVRQ